MFRTISNAHTTGAAHTARTVRASVTVALAALVLTGCSLAPTVPHSSTGASNQPATTSQTTKEACLALKPTLLSVTSEMNDAFDNIKQDPTAAVPLLNKVSGELRDAIADLDNKDVVDVATTATDSLDAMTVQVQKAIDGNPDQAALLAAATKVQTDFNAIDTVCKAAVN